MLNYLPLILKNSLRNRRRSLLTIVSIAASLCLLGVLLAVYYAFYFSEPTPEQALRLITRNRVSLASPFPIAYGEKIKQVPGVREVMISQWFGGVYKDARDPANFFARFAVEPEKFFTIFPERKVPEDQKQAFLRDQTACIVGRKLADRLNFKVGERIVLQGDIFPVKLELTVRGIYDSERDNDALFFHFKYLNESLSRSRWNMVSTLNLIAERPEDVPRIAQAVDDMFRNSPMQTKTESEQAFVLSFLAFLGNVKLFLLSICGAVTFTMLLVSGNTMAMSVRERVREVGILKTLGYTPGGILGIILGESAVISLAGGGLGLLLAWALCGVVRQAPPTFADLSQLSLPPSVAALCLSLALLIGLVSSVIPAWNASRRSIVASLRFTD